ncbi:MAG: cyclic lactone autoinducer peptide [Lachnospiraceae bacterium]|nr:cyclic lactone autoinducer peptide [Lachnospiraceae bacterium]
MKLNIKDKVKNFAEKTAVKSYGKSVPIFVYEPKVPEALKKTVEEQK